MRTSFASCSGMILALSVGGGCFRISTPAVATQTPKIVVDVDAGMPADLTSRSSGVRLAVWEDGTVLFGADPMHPAKDMRVGQLSPAELEAAWKAVRESGLTTNPDISYVVPDSSSVRVVINLDGKTHAHWLSNYRWAGIDWWPKAEEAQAKFRPTISQPVAEVATDGMYRGYNVKEWWLTSWRR